MLGFPYNISATAKASNLKIGSGWGLPGPIIKSHNEKVDVALG